MMWPKEKRPLILIPLTQIAGQTVTLSWSKGRMQWLPSELIRDFGDQILDLSIILQNSGRLYRPAAVLFPNKAMYLYDINQRLSIIQSSRFLRNQSSTLTVIKPKKKKKDCTGTVLWPHLYNFSTIKCINLGLGFPSLTKELLKKTSYSNMIMSHKL